MCDRESFIAALDVPLVERDAFVVKACGGDADLRRLVEDLLRAHQQAGSFLEFPALTPSGTTEPSDGIQPDARCLTFLKPSTAAGALGQLGHCEVQELLGQGGMGVVLRAFDHKLQRVVALKVLAPTLTSSRSARQRFVREARAAAAVNHDHVVPIHAVEDDGPMPYLVMQLIDGVSLEEKIRKKGQLELREVLRIGMQIAEGLAAAHRQGLVHRDIKPANLLLEKDSERVKITDFGLACTVADAGSSHVGLVAGTPQYMSPEQARGEVVDARSDLFSLGSVLFAMCAGAPPFQGTQTREVLRKVCEEPPLPLRKHNLDVPLWLVAIIDRLHAKDPAERFQSAAEVASLLARRLAQVQQLRLESLPAPAGSDLATTQFPPAAPSARPAGWRLATAVAAALLLLLVGGLGVTEATGVTRLASAVIRVLTPEGTLVVEVDDPGVRVTIEGDGGLLVTGAGPQELRLRPGSYRVEAARDGQPVHSELVTVSRAGKRVVTVSLESLRGASAWTPPPPGPLDALTPSGIPASERFPWQPRELVGVLGEHRGRQWTSVQCVAISPDGKLAASGSDSEWSGVIYVWDAETLQLRGFLEGHRGRVWSLAFDPSGQRLVSGGADRSLRVWDVRTLHEIGQFGQQQAVASTAFFPDGLRVLSTDLDGDLHIWYLAEGRETARWTGHAGACQAVIAPGGMEIVSVGIDRTLCRWDVETTSLIGQIANVGAGVSQAAFLPGGRRVLTVGERTVRIWDLDQGEEVGRLEGHTGTVYSAAASPDGRQAVSCGQDGALRLWDLDSGEELECFRISRALSSVELSPDGRRALTGDWSGGIRLWDVHGRLELQPHIRAQDSTVCFDLKFSRDGRHVVSCMAEHGAQLWDVVTDRPMHWLTVPRHCWGAGFCGADREVVCSGGSGLIVFDAVSGKELRHFAVGQGFWNLAVSPDGRSILTGDVYQRVRLWDLETGRECAALHGHGNHVLQVAVAPDGRRVLSAGADRTVRLWDLETFGQVWRGDAHTEPVVSVAYASTGKHAASAGGGTDATVRLYDIVGAELKLRPIHRRHDSGVNRVAFSADGLTLGSVGNDGRVVLCDVATGKQVREWQLPGRDRAFAFAPDGRHLATINGNGTIYLLRLKPPAEPAFGDSDKPNLNGR